MTNLVHRDCGGDEFTQRQPRLVEVEFTYDPRGGFMETGKETVLDSDRDEEFVCAECGDEVGPDDRITQEEYDACEHADSEDGYCLDCAEYVGPDGTEYEVDA
jgi:hypothetical protein